MAENQKAQQLEHAFTICTEAQFDCGDGTCGDTLADCGFTNPDEFDASLYTDEYMDTLEEIYNEMGGKDKLGINRWNFDYLYGEYFPTYDDSEASHYWDKMYAQDQLWDLAEQGYANDLEAIGLQRESAIGDRRDVRTKAVNSLRELALGSEGQRRQSKGINTGRANKFIGRKREGIIDEFSEDVEATDRARRGAELDAESHILDVTQAYAAKEGRLVDYQRAIDKTFEDYDDSTYDMMLNVEDYIDADRSGNISIVLQGGFYDEDKEMTDEEWIAEYGEPPAALQYNDHTKVLCTELHRQGIMSDELYQADVEFAKTVDEATNRGYRLWATPIAKKMKTSKILTSILTPGIMSWAKHMAGQKTLFGTIAMAVGVPICRLIGEVLISREAVINKKMITE